MRWHSHEFTPGNLTPKSCVVCGHSEDSTWHASTNKNNWDWTRLFRLRSPYGS